MATTKLSIKLLIDTKKKKVLFAEVGKDFVDFLFNLLALPVGAVIHLLSPKSMVGSVGNLYKSVENLSAEFMQPDTDKESILKPKTHSSATNVHLLLSNDLISGPPTNIYICDSLICFYRSVSTDSTLLCTRCWKPTRRPAQWIGKNVANAEGGGGYVKGAVTYMVMDDLEVKPMSTISSITLMNKFNVKDVRNLEEKVVDLTMDDGLKLLKTSLQYKSVLTNVFLV